MLRAEDVKEEFLICSVCMSEFDEDRHVPRVLPCLHTFCHQCLQQMAKGSKLHCPVCKSEHVIPKQDIYGFPKDTTRRNLIDFLRVRKRSSDILCKDCPEDKTAADFCKECYIFMCVECTKAHKRSYASRKHTVVSILELQRTGIEVFRRKLTCSLAGHEGQTLAFYCSGKGCEMAICTACTVCDHDKNKGHVIINVQDIYNHKREELDKMFETLDEDIQSAKLVLKQAEKELLNMDIKELEVEKDIDETFARCRKVLDRRQSQLKESLAILCEEKKANVQEEVELLEGYIDGAANAKDFSTHVVGHSDPSEFIPLYSILVQRLKSLNNYKVNKKTLKIESPAFEAKEMEEEFEKVAETIGKLNTVVEHKKLNISRGNTDITLSSASSHRKGERDQRFGEILCPSFTYDVCSVHQYRELSDNCRTLKNYNTVPKQPGMYGARQLKKYRGVVGIRSFEPPGKYYFEVQVSFNIIKSLDNINFVYEIGLSRRSEIDNGYYVYDQPHAWSFCAQHCEEHKQICSWCRHHGENLAHVPLSLNLTGTNVTKTFGFLLDTDKAQWTVVDCLEEKKIHTFQNLRTSRALWPVFGCHWPSKVRLEMTVRSGTTIERLPNVLRTN
ncbi:hypothetical protein ACJMK2_018999 [Sinanodonta woodiana]|uniref:Uncharacterized protein n=1 Tax=Sinanodonta woodiana TaxID=1069815 RepID=A0ABD3UF29_SINWO